MDIPSPEGEKTIRVGVMCECRSAEVKKESEQRKLAEQKERTSALRNRCIADPKLREASFQKDDNRQQSVSNVCRRYVAEWDEMKNANIGMLFYGDVDAGKTFFACCIANALIDKEISAYVTTLSNILNEIQGTWEKQEIMDKVQNCPLLVIDDLGMERDTAFGIEQISNIINARAVSGRPTIFTTNLSMHDLENPKDISHRRIYSRVLGMCPIKLSMETQNRRKLEAEQKRERALKILGFGER